MNGIEIHAFCDTNIAMYLLSGDEKLAELLQGMDAKLSVISELELLSKPYITPAEKTKTKAFISQCTVIELSPTIKEAVIELRQKIKIKHPDAIIAASAITMGLPLITADKQFEKVSGLDVIIIKR
jgi:predicted nucleic acid-binding protein